MKATLFIVLFVIMHTFSFAQIAIIKELRMKDKPSVKVVSIDTSLTSTGTSIPTSKAVFDAIQSGGGSSVFDGNRPILRIPSVGQNLGTTTVSDWLEWWYFAPPTVTIGAVSPSVFEIGTSNLVNFTSGLSNPSNLAISNSVFKLKNPIDSVVETNTLPFISSITYTPLQTPTGRFTEAQYSFRFESDYTGAESGTANSITRTIYGVYPILNGMSDTDLSISGNPFTELNRLIDTEGNKSILLNGVGFIYYAVPKTWSDFELSSIVDHNGFNFTGSFPSYDILVLSSGLCLLYTSPIP